MAFGNGVSQREISRIALYGAHAISDVRVRHAGLRVGEAQGTTKG